MNQGQNSQSQASSLESMSTERVDCLPLDTSDSKAKFGLATVLRPGWDTRVIRNIGITASGGGLFGGALAVIREAPSVASYAMRTAMTWGIISMPFFVLREVMSGARIQSEELLGGKVNGSVSLMDQVKDSGTAGLLTGYFGALWFHGPKLVKLIQWSGLGTITGVVGDLSVKALGEGLRQMARTANSMAESKNERWYQKWEWPVWFPVMRKEDGEYEELLRRKAIVEAELVEERKRIRRLLEMLEEKERTAVTRNKSQSSVPSSPVTDISTGDSDED